MGWEKDPGSELLYLFQDCLHMFTTQPSEMIFKNAGGLFYFDSYGNACVDMGHRFWREYAQAFWAIKCIADVFMLKYPSFLRSRDRMAFIQSVREYAEKRLTTELMLQARGVDLDIITAVAAERYETKAGQGQNILLLPACVERTGLPIALFSECAQLELTYENIHALRKQLNLAKNSCLVVCAEGARSHTVGTGALSLMDRFPCITVTGHAEWAFRLPKDQKLSEKNDSPKTSCLIRYEAGRLLLPLLDLSCAESEQINDALKGMNTKTAERILTHVKEQHIGAVVIMSSQKIIRSECLRLCEEKKRGIALDPPQRWLRGGKPVLPGNLTAIDGALLVDLKGKCWAYGVILDGAATEVGNIARGARYNSAKNYVRILSDLYQKAPLLAIVASDDGMVDLFP